MSDRTEIELIETTETTNTSLAQLDGAVRALAEASTLEEVKHIADIAEAARTYAKAAKLGLKAQNKAAEIHIRAQRKAGEMLSVMNKNPGSKNLGACSVQAPKLSELGIEHTQSHRWQRLASLPEEAFEEHIREIKDSNREITTASMLALGRSTLSAERNEIVSRAEAARDEHWHTLVASGKRFGTIYADPPWDDQNDAPPMTIDQLCALPVMSIVADAAHLHLWATDSHLFDAKQIIDAWGFDYAGCFVWVQPEIEIGNYWRVAHEFLLLGVRGSCSFLDKSLKSWVEIDGTEPSRKPEIVREMIERASPGPRIELFARQPVSGWTVWGNQIEGDPQAEETPRTSEASVDER